MSKVKNVVNRLATVNHVISASDYVEAISNGLPEEYDTSLYHLTLETYIQSNLIRIQDPLTWSHMALGTESNREEEIQVLIFKAFITTLFNLSLASIEAIHKETKEDVIIIPIVTLEKGFIHGDRHNGTPSNTNKPQCQVCGKPSHIALDCCHRFDQDF